MTDTVKDPSRGMSWRRAYGIAALLYVVIFAVMSLFIVQTRDAHEAQEMQVIDLTTGEVEMSGSGHAGGGSTSAADFPDPLSETEVAARRTEVQQHMEQALRQPTEAQAPANAQDSVHPVDAEAALFPDPAVPAESGTGSVGNSSDASGSDAGNLSGSNGNGVGEGTGNGGGESEGRGYGEGEGMGTGSGDSGAAGSGTAPFDTDGFWAAVNASKNYPFMAVKRHQEGTAGVAVTLDAAGNCVGALITSSSGSGMLDDAALSAVRAACPYPNPTGGTVTVNLNVNFTLQ